MSNNKPDRKLKLAVETVRVLNPRRKKRNVIDDQAVRTNASSDCPLTQAPPRKR
jgi:hypothetical protein